MDWRSLLWVRCACVHKLKTSGLGVAVCAVALSARRWSSVCSLRENLQHTDTHHIQTANTRYNRAQFERRIVYVSDRLRICAFCVWLGDSVFVWSPSVSQSEYASAIHKNQIKFSFVLHFMQTAHTILLSTEKNLKQKQVEKPLQFIHLLSGELRYIFCLFGLANLWPIF